MELTTVWVPYGRRGRTNMEDVNRMFDEGWELVQWHPVADSSVANPNDSVLFDVFLLKKVEAVPTHH